MYRGKDLNPYTGEEDRGSGILMDNWLKKPAASTQSAARTHSFLSFPVLPHSVLYYHVMPYLSCSVLYCLAVSYHTLSPPVLSCPVLSCPVMLNPANNLNIWLLFFNLHDQLPPSIKSLMTPINDTLFYPY